jgi:ankyrin repeat protein
VTDTDINAWLSANGFDLSQPLQANAAGQQALILAAQQKQHAVLNFLLQAGADLSIVDAYGNNALWAACFAEAPDCIALLLAAGIAIDYQNPSGATALIYAASSGKHAVVAQLLEAGANPWLATQDEFTALDLAATRPCLQLLRQAIKTIA